MVFGNLPNDGGNLILSVDEVAELVAKHPQISSHIKPLIGAKDFMSGASRHCLWLADAPMSILGLKSVKDIVSKVKNYRESSSRPATKALASFPAQFGEIRQTKGSFILVPRHGSDKREYLTLGFFNGGEIAHDSCLFIPKGSLPDFAILSSKMHMSWLKQVGGKIKSDYRYAVKTIYNTFPMPPVKDIDKLQPFAKAILTARAKHPDATLAELYDPDIMPADLRKAHIANDKAVDKLYRKSGFKSERERVEHLFGLYEKMTSGMLATTKKPRKRKAVVKP
jgi:hypothetical protein